MKFLRLFAALAPLFLSACGGGGGGGERGKFELDRQAVAFAANQGWAPPPMQAVAMTLTSGGTSYVGSGYVDVPDPGWLNVNITGAAPSYQVQLSVNTTGLAQGTHQTVLTVGTADSKGNILETRDIAVSYTLGRDITVTTSPVAASFTYGHDTVQQAFGFAVDAGVTDEYEATSDVGWVSVPGSSFTGPATLPSAIDVTGLAVGTHLGTVTVTNVDDPSESDTLSVTVTIAAPALDVLQSGIALGGQYGLDLDGAVVDFSVGTGTRTHPWTLALQTDDGGNWLLASSGSGAVDAGGAQVGIDADRHAVTGGVRTGSVTIEVDVDGLVLSEAVPVTFRKEAERLRVTAEGVAFAQLPSRELLTREVQVRSTWGRTGLPWAASSDQDWLAVTASGETGGALTLAADPTLLAVDTLHVATVTVESDDPLIENTQSIRVGLWIGSADPGLVTLPAGIRSTVMDPVAPWLYTHSGTDLVTVYNVYSGDVVTSYAAGTSAPGGMAIRDDGLTLFVADTASGQAFEVSAADGAPLRTFTPPYVTSNWYLAYARPDALPTLYFGNTYVADAQSGQFFETPLQGSDKIVVAADGARAYLHNQGVSPSTAVRNEVRRVALDGGAFLVTGSAWFSPGSNGADAAVAPDGSRFYAASGGYYAFPVFDGATNAFVEDLAGAAYPNNAETAWNGVFAGGASAYYDSVDLWFYDADGAALGTARCYGSSYNWLVLDSVRFSGDALRYACSAGEDVWGAGAVVRIRDVPGS